MKRFRRRWTDTPKYHQHEENIQVGSRNYSIHRALHTLCTFYILYNNIIPCDITFSSWPFREESGEERKKEQKKTVHTLLQNVKHTWKTRRNNLWKNLQLFFLTLFNWEKWVNQFHAERRREWKRQPAWTFKSMFKWIKIWLSDYYFNKICHQMVLWINKSHQHMSESLLI